jgi:methionyl-tRNA formyltransferase
MTSLNIVFAGTPAFTLPCLNALAASRHSLRAIYTQPDRPAGRGRSLQASAVKTWANTMGYPVYQPLHFKEEASIADLIALQPDILVVIAYGLILPQRILDIPRLGCINVHASLLPRWRGASPIQQAIRHGDTITGITIMQMDAGMDTGAILHQVSCPIFSDDTTDRLHDRLANIAATPLLETLDSIAKGTAKPKPQDDTLATFAPKIKKDDATIQWHHSALSINQSIRAFYPSPIAHTCVFNEVIRIHQASVVPYVHEQPPGTVLAIDKQGLLVATGQDALLIEHVQFSGGKVISMSDCLNSGRHHWQLPLVLG